VKGHRLHVRRKMKKIEASLIKSRMTISWKLLAQVSAQALHWSKERKIK